jgi:hypothetical protein
MALSGKRLFWVSIIMVELVLVYVAYRPVRDHLRRSAHPVASGPRTVRRPEIPSSVAKNGSPVAKSTPSPASSNAIPSAKTNVPPATQSGASKVVIASAKPSPIPRPRPRPQSSGLVVNAGLKTPEPLAAKPALAAPSPSSPLDGFWCRISQAVSDCDCRNGEEQASNRVMR